VTQVVKAVLRTGFRGWFSMEVFDAGLEGKAFARSEEFEGFCKGAMESYRHLLDECTEG